MTDDNPIAQHERRLAVALDRIAVAVDKMAAAAPTPARRKAEAPAPDSAAEAEIARLREALEAEKSASAQLTERLKSLRDRDGQSWATTDARVETMTRQLDMQGLELARMRKVTVQLRETLRMMNEAAVAGTPEPHLINKAMLVELEALRAQRQGEVAEMDEILTALDGLIEESTADA